MVSVKGIRDKVAIIGMGCTKFGEHWDKHQDDLIVDAVREAVEDSKIDPKDILDRLTTDLKNLNIPVYQGRVTRIDCDGEVKKVFTADGNVFRCLAIIIAAGIKVLVNEKDYLGRGLEVTSMGYEFMISHLKKLLSKRWEPRLVVVGSPKLKNLIPINAT